MSRDRNLGRDLRLSRKKKSSWKKKVPKKVLFSLMARPFTPLPPLNGPAIKRRTFFAASLKNFKSSS